MLSVKGIISDKGIIRLLYSFLSSFQLSNYKSALQNSDFALNAINQFLKVGSAVECPVSPVVVNPLSVSIQSNEKKRLILNIGP